MSSFEIDGNGDPVGVALIGWTARPRPSHETLTGRTVRLEPLTTAHAPDLFVAYAADSTGRMWTYLGVGPFARQSELTAWIASIAPSEDPLFFAVIDQATGRAVGIVAYLRIDPVHGGIEVGWVTWSPQMQRSAVSTETHYLLMKNAFENLGYRRYEWKCNALNAPSMQAAARLGFTFEGTFRQAMIVKGRNRDTAWFSILDSEWPAVKAGFERWLDPGNFDGDGRQKTRLQACRAG